MKPITKSNQTSDHEELKIYKKRPLDSESQSDLDSDSDSSGSENNSSNKDKETEEEEETETETEEEKEEEEEEIQVLSHKERRKRRKLSKLATDPNPPNPNPANPNPKPTQTQKGQYGIWIGNLLYTTTEQDLTNFFKSCGKIIRLNFPIKSSSSLRSNQVNSGCAYLDFEDEESLKKALEKSESLLGGRKVLIKRSNDYSGRPVKVHQNFENLLGVEPNSVDKKSLKVLNKQSKPPLACLFLGNLSFESTSESIMKHFRLNHQHSTSNQEEDPGIRQIRLGTFEDTGKCKGFGFLDFRDTQAATKALMNLRNHSYLGRQILVEYASEDAARRGGGSHASLNRSKIKLQSKPQTNTTNFKSQTNHQDQIYTKNQTTYRKDQEKPIREINEFKAREESDTFEPRALEKQGIRKAFQGRLTPGAALANARRAPTGIIKNPEKIGKKIVFE
ncbi:hypothetical protein DFH28DRAFT_1037798 [Melampsora americana]|nr:hypothetical protein DFH28DRAFT_1037798 [Melampsora americana]